MKVDSVASQYLKLNRRTIDVGTNQNAPDAAGARQSRKAEQEKVRTPMHKMEAHLPEASNPKLAGVLDDRERETIASLFGTEGLAKLNALLDSNGGVLPDIPRGVLVNLQA